MPSRRAPPPPTLRVLPRRRHESRRWRTRNLGSLSSRARKCSRETLEWDECDTSAKVLLDRANASPFAPRNASCLLSHASCEAQARFSLQNATRINLDFVVQTINLNQYKSVEQCAKHFRAFDERLDEFLCPPEAAFVSGGAANPEGWAEKVSGGWGEAPIPPRHRRTPIARRAMPRHPFRGKTYRAQRFIVTLGYEPKFTKRPRWQCVRRR